MLVLRGDNMFDIKIEFNKGILFARLKGPLVRENTIKINRYLLDFIIENKVKYLVYNLYDLTNIDASGIDAILNTRYIIKKNKGMICVCETPTKLQKVFKHLNINMVPSELCARNLIRI